MEVEQESLKVTHSAIENNNVIIAEKVAYLSSELEKFTKSPNDESHIFEQKKQQFSCKHCEYNAKSKVELQNHIKSFHPRFFNCNVCDKTFNANYKLEEHLTGVHGMRKRFECTECESKFVLQLRLKKHLEGHTNKIAIKTCHYYNNDKNCPYEKIGCKFLHKKAKICKFSSECSRTMCQYRHC